MKETVPLAVHVLLDCSGSMDTNRNRAVDAMNAFLEQLALSLTPAMVTMSRFNTHLREPPMIENEAIYNLPKLSRERYVIRGGTDIYRSVLSAIALTKKANATTKVMVVLTDGLSDTHYQAECRRRVEAMQGEGWLFLFLGMVIEKGLGLTEADIRRLSRQMLDTAKNLGVKPEHRITVPFAGLAEAMQEAAVMCLEFQGTGTTKFGKEK